MISSSMLSAAMSSFVLGVFMCALIIISRMFRINPGTDILKNYSCNVALAHANDAFPCTDNIACPMASSLGDVVTLVILAGCSHTLLASLGAFQNYNDVK